MAYYRYRLFDYRHKWFPPQVSLFESSLDRKYAPWERSLIRFTRWWL